MSYSDRKIKIKVVFGYIFIMIFAIAASWYLYSKVVNLVVSGGNNRASLYNKSIVVTEVISSLYKIEYSGGMLLRSYSKRNLNKYNLFADTLNKNLNLLRSMTTSQEQSRLLDEIEILILNKKRNFKELAILYGSAGNDNIYDKAIDKAIVETASKNDTVSTIVAPRRSFFRRVGDIFSPPKTDTVVFVKEQAATETLQSLKNEIEINREKINRNATAKYISLVANDQEISSHISALIFQLNTEASSIYTTELIAREKDLHSTGTFVALVVIALFFSLVIFALLILRDINRSAVYKKELEAARSRAEYLMQSRHRMLLNISHDIKAPLCSVTGYLDLIKNSSDLKAKEYAESMKISTSYIMDLITNLLEYSRLESGKSEVKMSGFNLDKLMIDIIAIFEIQIQTKGIKIRLQKLNDRENCIETDLMRIRQITMNLLSNAVKFTEKGEIVLSYEVTQNNCLKLRIKDSGCGIAKDRQSGIYDEFSRIDSNTIIEGSGLGLSVVRGSVLLLGGGITLDSELGRGTIFTVTIPITVTEGCKEQNNSVIKINKGLSINILVIDDDALQLKMSVELLRSLGHIATTASSIEQVEKILSGGSIDVIISDLQMGTFSGFELLRYVRDLGYKMPIVAVSAKDGSVIKEVADSGFSAFLRKPFTLNELRSVIDRFCDKIDFAALNELMMGDEEAVKEILELFYSTTDENIILLERYNDKGDFVEVKNLCHKMLPMFLQLNIHHIAADLKEIDNSDVSSISREQVKFLIQSLFSLDTNKSFM